MFGLINSACVFKDSARARYIQAEGFSTSALIWNATQSVRIFLQSSIVGLTDVLAQGDIMAANLSRYFLLTLTVTLIVTMSTCQSGIVSSRMDRVFSKTRFKMCCRM